MVIMHSWYYCSRGCCAVSGFINDGERAGEWPWT